MMMRHYRSHYSFSYLSQGHLHSAQPLNFDAFFQLDLMIVSCLESQAETSAYLTLERIVEKSQATPQVQVKYFSISLVKFP